MNYPAVRVPGMLPSDPELSTRDRVVRAVGEDGPVTANALATALGLTPAAVRRHLDALLVEGLIRPRPAAVGPRRRGRPAKAFVLTEAGQALMATGAEDDADLALSALRFLSNRHGRGAVREFAVDRAARMEARYRGRLDRAPSDPGPRAEHLAEALSADGFAATTRPVGQGTPLAAVQLCQGHCPIRHVAAEFPELCEAEADLFSRLLGVHVQRLATLAQGDHVCTTHVPVGHRPPGRGSSGRAGSTPPVQQMQHPTSGRTT